MMGTSVRLAEPSLVDTTPVPKPPGNLPVPGGSETMGEYPYCEDEHAAVRAARV